MYAEAAALVEEGARRALIGSWHALAWLPRQPTSHQQTTCTYIGILQHLIPESPLYRSFQHTGLRPARFWIMTPHTEPPPLHSHFPDQSSTHPNSNCKGSPGGYLGKKEETRPLAGLLLRLPSKGTDLKENSRRLGTRPQRPHKHKDPTSWFEGPRSTGIPETILCRIFVVLWSFGPLPMGLYLRMIQLGGEPKPNL